MPPGVHRIFSISFSRRLTGYLRARARSIQANFPHSRRLPSSYGPRRRCRRVRRRFSSIWPWNWKRTTLKSLPRLLMIGNPSYLSKAWSSFLVLGPLHVRTTQEPRIKVRSRSSSIAEAHQISLRSPQTRSRREAPSESQQSPRRPRPADLPPGQGPAGAALLSQETDPRPAVGGHAQTGRAEVPVLEPDGLVADRDGRPDGFYPREREVECAWGRAERSNPRHTFASDVVLGAGLASGRGLVPWPP
jgi:hypothetical protein